MNTSFYGGREGRSFVIVKEFKTIAEMVEKFRQGPSYKEVNFDEYVLINTERKNNPENGQIFRRGYDFASGRMINCFNMSVTKVGNDHIESFLQTTTYAYGAVYIGTIVGPAGSAPHVQIGKYPDFKTEQKQFAIFGDEMEGYHSSQLLQFLVDNYKNGEIPVDQNNRVVDSNQAVGYRNGAKITTYEVTYYFYFDAEEGWYQTESAPKIGTGSYNVNDGSMVLGAYYEGDTLKFNDNIDWCYYSIRGIDNETTNAYLGFRFVAPVTEFTAESINAYSTAGVERKDDQKHPFYSQWNIKVPKGVKGDAIKDIRVITASDEITIKDYEGPAGKKIIVGDAYNYDSSKEAKTTFYLGDFNQLENISIDSEGTVNIKSSNDDITYSNLFTWITQSSFESDTGELTMKFNNNKGTNIEHTLNYIKKVELNQETNEFFVTHSDPSKGKQNVGIINSFAYASAENNEPSLPKDGLWFVIEEVDF